MAPGIHLQVAIVLLVHGFEPSGAVGNGTQDRESWISPRRNSLTPETLRSRAGAQGACAWHMKSSVWGPLGKGSKRAAFAPAQHSREPRSSLPPP
jgi:hypothetical protein